MLTQPDMARRPSLAQQQSSRILAYLSSRRNEREMEAARGRQERRRSSSSSARSDAISPKSLARSRTRRRATSARNQQAKRSQRQAKRKPSTEAEPSPKQATARPKHARPKYSSRPSTGSALDWSTFVRKKSTSTTEICKPSSYHKTPPRDSRYGSLVAVETVTWSNQILPSDRDENGLPIFESDMRRPSEARGCVEIIGGRGARPSLLEILGRCPGRDELSGLEHSETRLAGSSREDIYHPQRRRDEGSISTISTSKFPLSHEDSDEPSDPSETFLAPDTPSQRGSRISIAEALNPNKHDHHHSSSSSSNEDRCKYCDQEQRFLQQCFQPRRHSEALQLQREAERLKVVNARTHLSTQVEEFDRRAPSRITTAIWAVVSLGLCSGVVGCAVWAVIAKHVGPAMISILLFSTLLCFLLATHHIWGYWHASCLGLRPTMKDAMEDLERQPLIPRKMKRHCRQSSLVAGSTFR